MFLAADNAYAKYGKAAVESEFTFFRCKLKCGLVAGEAWPTVF